MSMEFFRHAVFGRIPHAAPLTLVGEDPKAMRAELAKRMGCPEDRVEQELKALLGEPETFKPTVKEMKALLDRDGEAPCRKRGTEGRATVPDPVTRNDSTKDGNEHLEE